MIRYGFVFWGHIESKGVIGSVLASFFGAKSILKDLLASFWLRFRGHVIDLNRHNWLRLTLLGVSSHCPPLAHPSHRPSPQLAAVL